MSLSSWCVRDGCVSFGSKRLVFPSINFHYCFHFYQWVLLCCGHFKCSVAKRKVNSPQVVQWLGYHWFRTEQKRTATIVWKCLDFIRILMMCISTFFRCRSKGVDHSIGSLPIARVCASFVLPVVQSLTKNNKSLQFGQASPWFLSLMHPHIDKVRGQLTIFSIQRNNLRQHVQTKMDA